MGVGGDGEDCTCIYGGEMISEVTLVYLLIIVFGFGGGYLLGNVAPNMFEI